MEKTMKMALPLTVLFLSTLCACNAYNVLVVFPLAGTSHSILGDGIVTPLLNAGHKVTFIVGLDKRRNHPNLTKIVPAPHAMMNDSMMSIKAMIDKEVDFNNNPILHFFMHELSKTALMDVEVQKLLADKTQHFDAVIAEWMWSDVYSGLATVYDCPLIWFSSVEPHWQVLRLIDEHLSPAYNADTLTAVDPPFSFCERIEQLWIQISISVVKRYFYGIEQDVFNEALVPHIKARGRPVPDYGEVLYNASLMFGNSHVSMGRATRLPQNYKPIGGYHIDRNVKPLPDDLQKLLDNAKNGLIYFSMGSNLKSKDLPDEMKNTFLKVFGELKQTVLWKFEENLTNAPKNLHIVNWAPQNSILAHPNTVLFITHGGLLSTTEAIHFAKPIIGIPVFADQFINTKRAVSKGFAREVELTYTMEGPLREAIKEMLSNPKYAQKAKEISFIYHDRPVHPSEEVRHWTEHVIETNGAPHLRSAALIVPWYQKMYLDLLVVLALAIFILIKVLKALCRTVCSKLCKKKNDIKKNN